MSKTSRWEAPSPQIVQKSKTANLCKNFIVRTSCQIPTSLLFQKEKNSIKKSDMIFEVFFFSFLTDWARRSQALT